MLIIKDTLEKKLPYNCEMDVTPFLQPVINTYDNCIVGAEILCRVKTKRGYILNQLHIEELEVPERADFYARELLLKTAELLRKNDGSGEIPSGFVFSLNITCGQINSQTIRNAVVKFKSCFKTDVVILLEIVERNITDATSDMLNAIAFYDSIGVKFAIDDAGINTAAMKFFGVDNVSILKLDRSVTQIKENYDLIYRKLIDGIVKLSSLCSVHIVAEGVENQHQKEALEEAGIIYMQGYYFSRPLSIADFCDFMKHYR
ncbi:EAL domain-containing protein [Pseudenterobacter timonensis]|uniref:EAL domain-containing protein n=1 Tax=Pseudenterobacter timonensis TaxID=1755099 RepID=A0AAE4DKI6_9ENTR|nr:EAL domain-containing protein [Pseudenterobacter timonensis]MDR9889169.1 EAL domain-containing protein [Pseudenterobacter timonensis]